MKAKTTAIDDLIRKAKLHRDLKPRPVRVLGISEKDVLKARLASKLGTPMGKIAKALGVSYVTAWKAVKAVTPYDRVK